MKTKIVAMTTMCGDIFDATGEIRPGGEALNFAAIANEYPHVEISLVGAIGDDECGRCGLLLYQWGGRSASGIQGMVIEV